MESLDSRAEATDFSLVQSVPTGSGAHLEPYSLRSRTLSSRVKRLGREAYHLPHSSTEVKNKVELYLHSYTLSWRAQGQQFLYLTY
jgi:hypothetical protein